MKTELKKEIDELINQYKSIGARLAELNNKLYEEEEIKTKQEFSKDENVKEFLRIYKELEDTEVEISVNLTLKYDVDYGDLVISSKSKKVKDFLETISICEEIVSLPEVKLANPEFVKNYSKFNKLYEKISHKYGYYGYDEILAASEGR